jgi:hypothetical protein
LCSNSMAVSFEGAFPQLQCPASSCYADWDLQQQLLKACRTECECGCAQCGWQRSRRASTPGMHLNKGCSSWMQVGNFITDKPSSRVLAAPGGGSQVCAAFDLLCSVLQSQWCMCFSLCCADHLRLSDCRRPSLRPVCVHHAPLDIQQLSCLHCTQAGWA